MHIKDRFIDIIQFLLTLMHVWAPYVIVVVGIFGIVSLILAAKTDKK